MVSPLMRRSGPFAEAGDGLGKNSGDCPTDLIVFGGMDLQGIPYVYIRYQFANFGDYFSSAPALCLSWT
jgi:hypothetical protein